MDICQQHNSFYIFIYFSINLLFFHSASNFVIFLWMIIISFIQIFLYIKINQTYIFLEDILARRV